MIKKIFIRFLGPIIFLFVVYFYIDLNLLKTILSGLKLQFFILSIILVPVLLFVRSFRWGKILKKFGVFYSKWKCFRIYFVEMVAIMATATFGTFIKCMYTKRDGYGILRPILSIISDKYFDYLLPFIFGITSIVIIKLKVRPEWSLVIFMLIACLMFIPARNGIMVFSSRIIPVRLRDLFLRKGWDLKVSFTEIRRVLDWKTYLLSVLGFTIYYFVIYSLCKGLTIDVGFAEVVMIETITTVITLIPISFFGIGTRDVGLIAAFKLFEHSPEEAIALSMALLLLRIIIILMGSIFWFLDPPPFTKLEKM